MTAAGAFNSQMDFARFFECESPGLVKACYLASLDPDAAADAAQEAMARAWRHWPVIEHGNPRAWVRTVALNLCRSRWRRIKREMRLLPRTYAPPSPDTPLPEPELHAALLSLSQRQREAVSLFYWADLSVADCAQVMRTSEGTVKQHLARARQQLARQLGEEVEFV